MQVQWHKASGICYLKWFAAIDKDAQISQNICSQCLRSGNITQCCADVHKCKHITLYNSPQRQCVQTYVQMLAGHKKCELREYNGLGKEYTGWVYRYFEHICRLLNANLDTVENLRHIVSSRTVHSKIWQLNCNYWRHGTGRIEHHKRPAALWFNRSRPQLYLARLKQTTVTELIRFKYLVAVSVVRSTSYGDSSFAICGPSTWNSLPAVLQSINWCLCWEFQYTTEDISV